MSCQVAETWSSHCHVLNDARDSLAAPRPGVVRAMEAVSNSFRADELDEPGISRTTDETCDFADGSCPIFPGEDSFVETPH